MKRKTFRSADRQPRPVVALAATATVARPVVSFGEIALEQNGHGRRHIDGETADGFQCLAPILINVVKVGLAQIIIGALWRPIMHN